MATRTIGGINYRELTETTMEQDDAILREVRTVGIDSLQQNEGESIEEYVGRALSALIEGGEAFRILGCFLVPEDKEWSRALALETADAFRKATNPDDKAALRAALLPILLSFFVAGLTSVATSRSYSTLLRGIVGQPQRTAAPSTLASGQTLSARLPAGILYAPLRWLVGRFGKRS
jgi:hypothetical protein